MPWRSNPAYPAVVHATTAVATVTAVAVAVLVPLLYFYFGYQYHVGSVHELAESKGEDLMDTIARNPQMWEFETLRMGEKLMGHEHGFEQRVRVFNERLEEVIVAGSEALPAPLVRETAPLYDAGRVVGRIELARSLRPLLVRSLAVFGMSLLLGGLILVTLRTLPLRLLRKALDRAAFLASYDPLTQLPNRTLFGDFLSHTIAEVERRRKPAAVLCIDLDRFKEVNDVLGHAAGDDLLKQVTLRMCDEIRDTDVLARLGGDEFAVIQNHAEQPAGAAHLADRLIEVASEPFSVSGTEVTIGASIGICLCEPGAAADTATMLQQADLALYRAKNEGRGSYRFFEDEMNRRLIERKSLEAALRRAIAGNSLQLHYQPQLDLVTGAVRGVEALLRWHDPELGWIPPDRFIKLAEETGLIVPIGDWVIRTACRDAAAWPDLRFAINVSPVQFRHPGLLETVRSALDETGIGPNRLEIEITEGLLLQNTEAVLETLSSLKAMGVSIAMDDFGTGYSSLSYLRRFPFDKIKIDRSFVADLGRDPQADSIVDAVIALGRSLGMRSNAEGVESIEQVDVLRNRGCKEVQGFYFARPMSESDMKARIVRAPEDGLMYLTGSVEEVRKLA